MPTKKVGAPPPPGRLAWFKKVDKYLWTRLLLPLGPPYIILQTQGLEALGPETLGSLSMVLSLRLLADQAFGGIFQIIFGFVPLVEAILILGRVSLLPDRMTIAWAAYGIAVAGTTIDVLLAIRDRR